MPPLSLLLLVLLLGAAGARAQRRFEVWFPHYRVALTTVIRDNCSREWEAYRTGDARSCSEHFCRELNLMDCALAHSKETVKANMANAGVLLGSLPTTLGFLGTTTGEIGLLAGRRPLLAALLAAGSPAVSPLRTVEYRGPLAILQRGGGLRAAAIGLGRTPPSLFAPAPDRPAWAAAAAAGAVAAAEYGLAGAAVANLGHLGYQLCIQAVYSFSPAMRVHPALWLLLGLAVHGGGVYAVWLRVRLDDEDEEDEHTNANSAEIVPDAGPAWRRRVDEFRLCALQRRATLHARPESLWFVCVSWATATGTVLHILYGTLIFSSTLFVGTRDAFVVVARFFGSMVVCRAVLMFEISGMRDVVRAVEGPEVEGSTAGTELQSLPLLQQHAASGTERPRASW